MYSGLIKVPSKKALFRANAAEKHYVELGQGTHSVMLERNRMQLFRAVQAFLASPGS